ncbi:hypothetical protein K4L44_06560 [Halosquirtibacter laminarini]|uniref:Uncharacterized protein n=1 Tax=Halosquirtibacter laminarini TaxID=3374600 RepID=A0AC61NIX0_9BACT|nr:hypothetical protein K4L44_06560 [Prolixibacteraceae bacterium]
MGIVKYRYTVTMFSDWHIGSGLSGGAELDMVVLKDHNRLPYIPGKTIKGLVREMSQLLCDLDSYNTTEDTLMSLYGSRSEKGEDIGGNCSKGTLFFSDATLEKDLQEMLLEKQYQDELYSIVASTAIGEDGIAKKHSLRSAEVTIPLILSGVVMGDFKSSEMFIQDSFSMIKRLGIGRNRGCGRCEIKLEKEEQDV